MSRLTNRPTPVVGDGGVVSGYTYDEPGGTVVFPALTPDEAKRNATGTETDGERRARIEGNRTHCFGSGYESDRLDSLFANAVPADDPRMLKAYADYSAILAECKAYAAEFRPHAQRRDGLLLYGETGRGKTFMAGCICNALTDRGYRCLITTTGDVASDFRKRGQKDVLWRLTHDNDVVVLDELFRDRNTATAVERREAVVFALCRSRCALIVTCNASKPAILTPNEANKPCVERLKERCRLLEFPSSLPNMRQMRVMEG